MRFDRTKPGIYIEMKKNVTRLNTCDAFLSFPQISFSLQEKEIPYIKESRNAR